MEHEVRSWMVRLLGLGEVLGQFVEAAGADQLMQGGVAGWRQCPVATSGVAVPNPPPRVLPPELCKPAIPGAWSAAGGH